MELHLRSLYTHDAVGRITSRREPGTPVCARFHLGRTRLGNLWRFRGDLSRDDVRNLARLAGKEAALASEDLSRRSAPPERLEPIRRVLRASAPIEFEWAGPAFRFPDDLDALEMRAHDASAGALPIIAVRPGDEAVLADQFADEIEELFDRQPCFAALDGGNAVALCYGARPLGGAGNGVEPCVATEAGVRTAPSHRGQGLAGRVVAAWAAEIVRRGACPLYSTSWQNRASRAVARKLGLICFGEDVHLR